jgi:hypothetical protein
MKLYCLGPVSPRFVTVSAATNATPIVVTFASGLTGSNAINPAVDVITIGGGLGNTNTNGTFAPGSYILNSPTSITLSGKAGNGAYSGSGIASVPQQLVFAPNFPTIQGVTDVTKIMVARMLFVPAPAGTATLYVGAAGLNQFTLQNVFRPINPPPPVATGGIYDFYDLELDGNNVIPIVEYWVDAFKPGTEAVLCSFWIR